MLATLNFKSLFLISGSIDLSTPGNTTMRKVMYWIQQNPLLPQFKPSHFWYLLSELWTPVPVEREPTQPMEAVPPQDILWFPIQPKLGLCSCSGCDSTACSDPLPVLAWEPRPLGWVEVTALQIQKFKQFEFHSQWSTGPFSFIRVWWCHYESFFHCITVN